MISKKDSTKSVLGEEAVIKLSLAELHPFPGHPFKVRDDEAMSETAESVREYGVLVPAIVRPRDDGGYEIIAGHRRKHACELAGLDAMPVIIRNLDDDAATIIMVDSNMQRENILPSERAQAYKMKMEAIKRQAGRPPKNAPQVAANFRSDDEVAKVDNMPYTAKRNAQPMRSRWRLWRVLCWPTSSIMLLWQYRMKLDWRTVLWALPSNKSNASMMSRRRKSVIPRNGYPKSTAP